MTPSRYIRSGNVILDYEGNRLWRLGEEISLSAAEFAILWHLALNHGLVVTHASISDMLNQQGFAADKRNIESITARLRQKLGEGVIITYRGIGYRLA